MQVHKLSPSQWSFFSRDAHKIAFGEIKEPSSDRIDYALLVVSREDKPAAYVTCREHDSRTVYWQFGGTMPGTRGGVGAFRAFEAMVEFARPHYDRVTCLIENTNTPMLKMAMKANFRVVGIRTYKGSILLEHLLEFHGGE